MSLRYLLDTNTASYAIRHQEPVSSRLAKTQPSQIAISVVTEAEFWFGLARRPHPHLRAKIESFLVHVTVLPWDSAAAQKYGEMRAQLESTGKTVGALDLLIGAHAASSGLILVSHDHVFSQIKKLKLEDWS
jgi:tRNA(fMet)-specific endonuclease VapC